MASSVATRFWNRVIKADGCWEWQGAIGKHGYGILKIAGTPMLAHRVSWQLVRGAEPIRCVLHTCDNRRCVRPDHLFLGTKKDNSDDMITKGRQRHPDKGENGNSKLSDEDVQRIRALRGKYKQTELAQMFGIKQPHVSRILRGVTWKK